MKTSLTITAADLRRGCEAYEKHEGRDSMYRVATYLLDQWWGKPPEMVDALSVLLTTWNVAFYLRFGMFNPSRLESCLQKNWKLIECFHSRDIASFKKMDHQSIDFLFKQFLVALQSESGRRSPVAVAKTLHLLAPSFMPIWDNKIAQQYGCRFSANPSAAYVSFCEIISRLASRLKPETSSSSKTLLKQIDEFNYAKYTQSWI